MLKLSRVGSAALLTVLTIAKAVEVLRPYRRKMRRRSLKVPLNGPRVLLLKQFCCWFRFYWGLRSDHKRQVGLWMISYFLRLVSPPSLELGFAKKMLLKVLRFQAERAVCHVEGKRLRAVEVSEVLRLWERMNWVFVSHLKLVLSVRRKSLRLFSWGLSASPGAERAFSLLRSLEERNARLNSTSLA